MNKWVKITLWVVFVLTVIVLLFVVQNTLQNLPLQKPSVQIKVDGENSFLTESELVSRLEQKNLLFVNQKVKELDIEKIEHYVRSMEEVKTVKVFSFLNGGWDISVELRRPIAHIFNSFGENFYLDSDGETIHNSSTHNARVLVVSGEISDRLRDENVNEIINNDSLKTIRKLDDVYRISNYVCNDALMQSLIDQVYRESNGDFILIPLVGNQKIVFGSAFTDKEVKEKFEKLKIFYKEAIPYEGWNKYSEISLKYDKQIVCKKKE